MFIINKIGCVLISYDLEDYQISCLLLVISAKNSNQ